MERKDHCVHAAVSQRVQPGISLVGHDYGGAYLIVSGKLLKQVIVISVDEAVCGVFVHTKVKHASDVSEGRCGGLGYRS